MIHKCVYIDTPDPAFLALDPKYQAGFLDTATVWRYAGDPENDLSEAFLRRVLAAHDECFAIRDGDRLAAYGWYSRAGRFHLSDTQRLHFDPRWAYMYSGFTNPAYRGQRLHAIGMTMALAHYRARGASGFVSIVEARNEASLKSCYRMGYVDFGTIYEIRLGRLLGIRKPKSRLLQRHLVVGTPGCQAFGFWLEALNPRVRWPWQLSSAADVKVKT
jgi:ribosomal protein S18 acetylase RimI-like enzyme